MQGSWSIKAVLPTIAPELDYTRLTVGNGGDAQDAYREIVHPNTPDARAEELTEGLHDYCTLDTLAMVRLAWYFEHRDSWIFLPSLIPGTQSVLVSDKTRQNPSPLLHNAEEALRQYCLTANTTVILQPRGFLEKHLKISFSHSILLVNQLEAFGILDARVLFRGPTGNYHPTPQLFNDDSAKLSKAL